MANKLITYTLHNGTREDYRKVQYKIRQISKAWTKIDETTYLLKTDRSSVGVRESIADIKLSSGFNTIFVTEWSHPSAWSGLSKEITDWLHNN